MFAFGAASRPPHREPAGGIPASATTRAPRPGGIGQIRWRHVPATIVTCIVRIQGSDPTRPWSATTEDQVTPGTHSHISQQPGKITHESAARHPVMTFGHPCAGLALARVDAYRKDRRRLVTQADHSQRNRTGPEKPHGPLSKVTQSKVTKARDHPHVVLPILPLTASPTQPRSFESDRALDRWSSRRRSRRRTHYAPS